MVVMERRRRVQQEHEMGEDAKKSRWRSGVGWRWLVACERWCWSLTTTQQPVEQPGSRGPQWPPGPGANSAAAAPTSGGCGWASSGSTTQRSKFYNQPRAAPRCGQHAGCRTARCTMCVELHTAAAGAAEACTHARKAHSLVRGLQRGQRDVARATSHAERQLHVPDAGAQPAACVWCGTAIGSSSSSGGGAARWWAGPGHTRTSVQQQLEDDEEVISIHTHRLPGLRGRCCCTGSAHRHG